MKRIREYSEEEFNNLIKNNFPTEINFLILSQNIKKILFIKRYNIKNENKIYFEVFDTTKKSSTIYFSYLLNENYKINDREVIYCKNSLIVEHDKQNKKIYLFQNNKYSEAIEIYLETKNKFFNLSRRKFKIETLNKRLNNDFSIISDSKTSLLCYLFNRKFIHSFSDLYLHKLFDFLRIKFNE